MDGVSGMDVENKSIKYSGCGRASGGYHVTASPDWGHILKAFQGLAQTILKKLITLCFIRSKEANNIDPRILKKSRNNFLLPVILQI